MGQGEDGGKGGLNKEKKDVEDRENESFEAGFLAIGGRIGGDTTQRAQFWR